MSHQVAVVGSGAGLEDVDVFELAAVHNRQISKVLKSFQGGGKDSKGWQMVRGTLEAAL